MYLKNIIQKISLSFFSFKFITKENDCQKIENFLNEQNISNSITECIVNNEGNVININMNNYYADETSIKKILSYETIENLHYTLYEGDIEHTPSYLAFPLNITNLLNLKELNLEFIGTKKYRKGSIKNDVLKVSPELKKLTLKNIEISQSNIDEIALLKNLEELSLIENIYPVGLQFDNLKNLKNLNLLNMPASSYLELEEFPSFIYSLTELKKLIVTNHKIQSVSQDLANLKNLEYLDLSNNNIDITIPESLNTLDNLKYIDLRGNKNFKGRTLSNSSLEECYYDDKYSLCKSKSMNCFEKEISFDKCTSRDNKESEDGHCGKGNGICPENQCCGKDGLCGNDEEHCLITNGCQSGYGICFTNTVSINGRCGSEIGKCPKGQCCNKDGYCGTSNDHCSISLGCQINFGDCLEELQISTNGKCGSISGKCPPGECCNKNGYCGTTDDHCVISNGCQIRYGECTENKTSNNGRCGVKDGKCPPGECCSKYGWCGQGIFYCYSGCQAKFGICNQ